MISIRLKSIRESHGDTQQLLADKLGLPKRTYASYERNERDIPNDVLVAFADLYNVTTDYLLGRTDTPTLYRHDMAVGGVDEAYLLTTQKQPPTPEEREQLNNVVLEKLDVGETIQLRPDELPRNRQELEQVIRQMIAELRRSEDS